MQLWFDCADLVSLHPTEFFMPWKDLKLKHVKMALATKDKTSWILSFLYGTCVRSESVGATSVLSRLATGDRRVHSFISRHT